MFSCCCCFFRQKTHFQCNNFLLKFHFRHFSSLCNIESSRKKFKTCCWSVPFFGTDAAWMRACTCRFHNTISSEIRSFFPWKKKLDSEWSDDYFRICVHKCANYSWNILIKMTSNRKITMSLKINSQQNSKVHAIFIELERSSIDLYC